MIGERGDDAVSEGFERYQSLFAPVVKGMTQLLGDRSEFILHDLSCPEASAVVIEGNVTKRRAGASVTNIVLEAIKKYGDDAPDMIGYESVTADGRPLKSSTIFIRSEEGRIVGCLCCNIDMTDFTIARNLLNSMCEIQTPQPSGKAGDEVFAQDIREVMSEIIHNEISASAKPVPMMDRSERLNLIRELENKCVFEVKGSVETTARKLGVSAFTVYSYLKEIRNEKIG